MRIFYGWIIAGAILLAWGISVGPRQSFSIFLLPFAGEFGASRSATAAAFSIHMASYALGGWLLGIIMDRVGPRRIIAWSTGIWALVLVLCSRLQSIWQLYVVYGVLGGAATGGLSYVANNAILSRWFVRYRGLATGIAQAGIPLGTAVYGPLAQLGIASLGWRMTHVVFGLFVAATALPLVLLVLRDDPKELGLLPDGATAPAVTGGGSDVRAPHVQGFTGPGLPRGYWPIFTANILRGLAMYAILVHQVAFLVDVGFTRMAAASYFSASFFLAVPGGLAAGAISDRIGRTRTYAGIAALYVIGYVSLLSGPQPLPGCRALDLCAGRRSGLRGGIFRPGRLSHRSTARPAIGFPAGAAEYRLRGGRDPGALSGGACVRLAGKLHPCLHPDGSLHDRLIADHFGHGAATPRNRRLGSRSGRLPLGGRERGA